MNRSKFRTGFCAAVLTGACALTGVAAAGSAHASGRDGGWGPDGWGSRASEGRSPSWGGDHRHATPAVVTAWTEVNVRDAPTLHARATSTLPAGAHIRLFCQTTGDRVNGTSTWYFDNDAHGWISAAHVHPTGWQPSDC